MSLHLVLTGVLIVGVIYAHPAVLDDAANLIGIGDSDACSALEQYFSAIGDGEAGGAMEYKFAVDRPKDWTDQLDSVSSVDCTCSEDVSDEFIKNTNEIPDSVSSVTDVQIATYTLTGVFQGTETTLEGGAVMFRPASKDWYVATEEYYRVDGQRHSPAPTRELLNECSIQ